MAAPHPPTPVRWAAGALAAGAAVVAACAGCAAGEYVSHEKTQHYDARDDAPVRGDLAFRLPDAVPADATDITVRVATREPDQKMYEWTSATAPTGCQPQDGGELPAPFDPNAGWPERVATAPGLLCGGLHVTEVRGRHYGWLVPGYGMGSSTSSAPSSPAPSSSAPSSSAPSSSAPSTS